VSTTNVYSQKADDTFHAAGASLNLTPSDRLNASIGLDWVQNDFETYFFGTNRRRFEAQSIVFDPRGISSFKVDTLSLSLNGDYQASDRLRLNAGYTFSKSDGDINTTGLEADLATPETQDDKIDHTLHSLMLGANYGLNKSMTLRGGYVFDKYDDDAYSALSGKVHTLMLGMSFAL
jgi:predicted porin